MDRSEPALVPEWLKSSTNVTGGGSAVYLFSSSSPSSLHSDDQPLSKYGRNKSPVSSCDHDIGHSSVLDRTTSLYFRRSSSSNGSGHSRSRSSSGRSHRRRDWEEIHDYCDKEKFGLGDHRQRDYSDPLENILPSRLEKDKLQHSQSMITGKWGDAWPRKVAGDLNNTNRSIHNTGNGLLPGSSVQKTSFERDFPSLGAEERHGGGGIGRVLSPGLSSATQSFPIGSSVVLGGDGWKSALAEVPGITGSNGTAVTSNQQPVSVRPACVPQSTVSGLNMAETLAQGPARARTTPQLSLGIQRLEELAIKKSKQLVPVTPSMTKALVTFPKGKNSLVPSSSGKVLSPSEKSKPKIGQQQHMVSSVHPVTLTVRGGPARSDVLKTNLGKLQVLNPPREVNGVFSTSMDRLSPKSGGKADSSPIGTAQSSAMSASSKNFSNNPIPANADRRPAVEKRPTSQAQSRNDFFNLIKKKSSTNSFSAVLGSDLAVSPSVPEKADELVTKALSPSSSSPVRDVSSERSVTGLSTESRGVMAPNGEAYDGSQNFLSNGEKHPIPSPDTVPCPEEEEETAFLRSLGWEENAGDDEGLTEEEISAFYEEYKKLRPSSSLLNGA